MFLCGRLKAGGAVPCGTAALVALGRAHLPGRRRPGRRRAGARRAAWLLGLVLALCARGPVLALDDARMQQAAGALGAGAQTAMTNLKELVLQMSRKGEMSRLVDANRYVNRRLTFTSDQQTWGQEDYWASPLEALARGSGDCEDYAIAKYFSLVAAGTPQARLRLVYVRAQLNGLGLPVAANEVPAGRSQAHMVLAYYPDNGGEPLILDNLVNDIKPASHRKDLTPVFSFNGEGLWDGAGPRSAGDPRSRLSRWRDVLRKARDEGFD
jgi:predicted transglutaminase-like cysteine proteinase